MKYALITRSRQGTKQPRMCCPVRYESATGDKKETESDIYIHQVMPCLPATGKKLQHLDKCAKDSCYLYLQYAGDLTGENGTRTMIPNLNRDFGKAADWSPGPRSSKVI